MWVVFVAMVPLMLALVGIGRWAQDFLFGEDSEAFAALAPVSAGHLGLMGILTVALVAMALNLVLPLSAPYALVVVVGLFLCGRHRQRLAPTLRRDMPWLLALALFHVWLASDDGPSYDLGLYHLPTLTWIRSFAQPIGVANLAPYLAYNSSWFPFEGALGLLPGNRHGAFAANPLAATFFLAAGLRILGERRGDFSTALFVSICLFWNYLLDALGQLSPNLASQMYALYGWFFLIRLMEEKRPFAALPALLFSAFAVSAKLFSLPALGFSFAAALWSFGATKGRRRFWWSMAAFGGLWLFRGLVSSGCLVFPQSLTCLSPLPWSAASLADSLSREIQRLNGGFLHWGLGDNLKRGLGHSLAIKSLMVFTVGLLGLGFRWERARAKRALAVSGAFAAGLCFWAAFALAIPRFALQYFVGIPGAALGAAAFRYPRFLPRLAIAVAIGIAFRSAYYTYPGHLTPWPYFQDKPYEERTTSSGQKVKVGTADRSCWDLEPPCTHDFSPGISYRKLPWGTYLFYRAAP